MQVGYWLYRNHHANKIVTGFAPLLELPYTGTLNDSDSINIVQDHENPFSRIDILNATIGSQINLARQANCHLGVALPLLGGQFDEAHVADTSPFAQFDITRRQSGSSCSLSVPSRAATGEAISFRNRCHCSVTGVGHE